MNEKLTTKNTITNKGIKKINSPEIDFEMYNDILGEEKVDEIYEESFGVNCIYTGDFFENLPIKIELLEKYLNELKKEGCNYVSIDYNCDHPDYIICGVDVHSSTEQEISDYEKNQSGNLRNEALKLREISDKYLKEAEEIEKKIKK